MYFPQWWFYYCTSDLLSCHLGSEQDIFTALYFPDLSWTYTEEHFKLTKTFFSTFFFSFKSRRFDVPLNSPIKRLLFVLNVSLLQFSSASVCLRTSQIFVTYAAAAICAASLHCAEQLILVVESTVPGLHPHSHRSPFTEVQWGEDLKLQDNTPTQNKSTPSQLNHSGHLLQHLTPL